MNSNFFYYSRLYLSAVFIIYCALNIIYTVNQEIWTQCRDEIAHYDYIDKLSDFILPDAKDDVSDYTSYLSFEAGFLWWKNSIPGFDGTAESAGLVNKSYEAHQPPLYYALLAVPNYFLKLFDVNPTSQLIILRLISLLFVLAGYFLVIPIFKEIKKITKVDDIYGYMIAVGLAIFDFQCYYALGNDSLSLFINNLAIYLLLLFWQRQQPIYANWAALVVALAILTKFTNGFILFVYFIILFLYFTQKGSKENKARILLMAMHPILLVGIYLIGNAMIHGYDYTDILGTDTTKSYFAHFIRPTASSYLFLQHLISHFFSIGALGITKIPFTWQWVMWLTIIAITLNGINCMIGKHKNEAYRTMLLISVFITSLVLLSAVLLNKYRPGVIWVDFRHYNGYALLLVMSIFNLPFFTEKHTAIVVTIFSILVTSFIPLYLSKMLNMA